MGKQHNKTFPRGRGSKTYTLFSIIHFDICGPFSTFTHYGCRYFITFIDDLSQYIIIYLFKSKFETFEKIKHYKAM